MKKPITIVADAHIWGVESAFGTLPGYAVDLRILEHQQITPSTLHNADVLITRSSTRVDASLLADSPVRFAATATIGDDHYDKKWLEQNGIGWANAAGSSTDSVIEYMIAALLEMHNRDFISIPDTTIGIIGVGRIGGKLARICEAIGMTVLRNDPPRARREGDASFVALDDLLEQADLLTLHTPLIRDGIDCTVHLLNQSRLDRFKGRAIINAGRGACLDNHGLLAWLDSNPAHFAVLDCWEHEPAPESALIAHPGMLITTPHIAGHSLDGKAANTAFAYRALCRFLNIEPAWQMQAHLPPPGYTHTIEDLGDCWQQLQVAAHWLYPVHEDSATMKSWTTLSQSELSGAFTGYRRHYPVRRAWACSPLHFDSTDPELRTMAEAIGMLII